MAGTGSSTRRTARLGIGLLAAIAVLASPSTATAHPLGNFSVNRLHTLTVSATSVIDDVVADTAEIPTTQNRPDVDTDGDGEVSDDERAAYASAECAAIVDEIELTADGEPTTFDVVTSAFSYEPGQAGLETSRLECRLEAPVAVDDVTTLTFVDVDRTGRVGWNEINAVATGVGLVDPPVPTSSVTDGLRTYPVDLLESPLDVREVTLVVDPDASGSATVDGTGSVTDDSNGAASARDDLVEARPGFFDGTVGRVQDAFDDVVGRRDLTIGVGLLAMGLALVLGASHALLPGHGKTVMAAYIAGRQGSTKDAVIVGATVTATHTGGVLLLGTALTVSTSLAGEGVLAWLGVISGLLIAALGLGLLISAIRHRDDGFFGHGHHHHGPGGHTHGPGDHSHDHGTHSHGDHDPHSHDDHGHDHGHGDHGHPRDEHEFVGVLTPTAPRAQGATPHAEPATAHQGHGHRHDAHAHDGHSHHHDAAPAHDHSHDHDHDHSHDHDHDHSHDHDHDHDHATSAGPAPVSRRGLVGMGVAGGLVPSPSALIILLSAIALGRTWFGVLLVVGYGVGMAATLTLAGVLLVKVRDRYQDRIAESTGRAATFGRRWSRAMPYLTAILVFVVGIGLAIRGVVDL